MNEPLEKQRGKPRVKRRGKAGVFAAGAALAAAAAFSSATPASANSVSYDWDLCSSNTGACFGLFYYGPQNSGVLYSSCFLTNRTIPDHWGRTEHGHTTRYEFRNQPGHSVIHFRLGVDTRCYPDAYGSGQQLENAAAAVANQDYVNHSVFYNSYYEGYLDTIPPGWIGRLIPAVRNNNASSRRWAW